MIVRTAKLAQAIDDTVVACDDEETVAICSKYDVKSVLTDKNHASGTDRINEACTILGLNEDEIVVNLQGDEPFLEQAVLKSFVEFTKRCQDDFVMTSAYKVISPTDANCPNLVKVVLDESKKAIYFSRSKIPYDRDGGLNEYFGHLGLYGFSRKSLAKFCSLKPTFLENTEKLEQLRAISNRLLISMLEVSTNSFGIDTKEDLEKALKLANLA